MDNLQLSQGGNLCLGKAGLAEGTNAATIQIAAAITFTVNGIMYSKAITDNIAIAYTAPDDTYNSVANGSFTGGANGSVRLYGIFINAGGTVSIKPGPIVDVAALAAGEVALQWPAPERDKACIGAVRVQLTSGTAFIPGTTDLGAAGVTDTYYDCVAVPGEPLTA